MLNRLKSRVFLKTAVKADSAGQFIASAEIFYSDTNEIYFCILK